MFRFLNGRLIGENIYAVMDSPPIKNFFNSIEYRCYCNKKSFRGEAFLDCNACVAGL